MASLPIDEILSSLKQALAASSSIVLQAPPGAGKTTHVPLALLEEPWLKHRSILVLEPRRLAARAAATRMASLLGEPVGETVGYRIRFDAKVSKKTRIEVLTEGILTRRLQSDPALEGAGLVIFDEFHERHLHADLALALCLDSRRVLRDDLKLLVMSATLEGAAVASLLGDAPVVTSQGRSFPIEVRYAARDPRDSGDLLQIVHQAVLHALEHDRGDLLVFLPGAWEIRRTEEKLKAVSARGPVDVCPLYGDLPWEAQDRAIKPSGGGRRKVVLATPIAETSLTLEGIGVVIDAGFVRVPEFDPRSGLSRLTTQRISRASAEQRAGRAGRLGPGVCYRLWSEATQRGLTAQPIPEIRAADLAPLALELAQWGVRDAGTLSWLDPPPSSALAQARQLLTQLGAVKKEDGSITPSGRAMASFPLHPRLAHMLYQAQERGLGHLACDLAAVLSERDLLVGEDRRSCDVMKRLEVLRAFREQGKGGVQSLGADPSACLRVDQAARQYQRLLQSKETKIGREFEKAGLLLAFAYPDRIAQQRAPGDVRYLLASGRGARLPDHEQRMRLPTLVVASLDAGEVEGMIYLAAPVDIDLLRQELDSHLRTEEVIRWDTRQQRVIALREERLGELVIDSAPLSSPDPEKIRGAMLEGIRQLGVGALPWTPEARDWQARVLSLRHWFPEEGWPDLSDAALQERFEEWLGPFLIDVTRREHLKRLDLLTILKSRLDWNQGRRLEEGAPTHLAVPSGSRLRLEYKPGESPVLAVKLQEMFGLADTPRVAWGRVPVTLHLLSPARRPIQVTQDLRGFWERTYAEVKKELKGRYPKHPWPDDPWNAPPTARTKKRSS